MAVRTNRSEASLVGWYAAYIVARERGKAPEERPDARSHRECGPMRPDIVPGAVISRLRAS